MSFIFALITWVIFYPGILSVDSLSIIREARLGDFSDIRSPFITILLSLFLQAGGTLGLLTLLQCLLGFFGFRRLALAITELFSIERARQEWIACFVIVVLTLPLTPMPVYFATFWLDTWLAIFLLWVAALLLELANDTSTVVSGKNRVKIFLLIMLMIFVMLTRLNSPILHPTLTLGLLSVLWKKSISRKALLALALSPLLFYLPFVLMQHEIIGVKRAHQERIVLALDLASMLTYDPSICQTLSLRSCDIIQGRLSPEFVAGNGAIDHTLNQGLGTMEPAFVELAFSSFLFQDMWGAVKHYPVTYAEVKVLNFMDYIRPRDRYYYQSFMHPNNLGFVFNPRFDIVRNKVFVLLHEVYEHPILKFFSFVHLPWLIINLIGILFCFLYKPKSEQLKILCLILFIPATYYGSYLIALTASDFRFMYPSTLLVQVIILTLIAQIIAVWATAGRWRDTPLGQSIETIQKV
ncbi:MAG TPA: hypothetical protein VFR47_13860 [Anaerolineales bacterium]|nr:hypothetical protein [Anaerolineales bacterium]